MHSIEGRVIRQHSHTQARIWNTFQMSPFLFWSHALSSRILTIVDALIILSCLFSDLSYIYYLRPQCLACLFWICGIYWMKSHTFFCELPIWISIMIGRSIYIVRCHYKLFLLDVSQVFSLSYSSGSLGSVSVDLLLALLCETDCAFSSVYKFTCIFKVRWNFWQWGQVSVLFCHLHHFSDLEWTQHLNNYSGIHWI